MSGEVLQWLAFGSITLHAALMLIIAHAAFTVRDTVSGRWRTQGGFWIFAALLAAVVIGSATVLLVEG